MQLQKIKKLSIEHEGGQEKTNQVSAAGEAKKEIVDKNMENYLMGDEALMETVSFET